MRFIAKDPDIETIVRRIEEHDYDLQPDFQRGEVWSLQKKRRLIDTLLREWHVPPVHLVSGSDGRSDVLDGQQRLTAIRDFVRGHFTVDGTIEPLDQTIRSLHGKRYSELPEVVARSFRKTTLRVFELVDYSPEEPHELFFRLNQPTSLTEAEKRNAFIGAPRNQVRELVAIADNQGLLGDSVGFSNARMAYDDVFARALVTIESGTLDEKVTASRVTQRYRLEEPFRRDDIERLRDAMEVVLGAFREASLNGQPLRPNKATIHTWLCVGAQIALFGDLDRSPNPLTAAIYSLETARWGHTKRSAPVSPGLIAIFQNRSTARVADVSSVVMRDLIAWIVLSAGSDLAGGNPKVDHSRHAHMIANANAADDNLEEILLAFAANVKWGSLGWH